MLSAIVRGGELLCSEQETEPHRHDESCYAEADIQTEQTSDGREESGRLICGLDETKGHIHDESCVCPGGELICGLEDEDGSDYDLTDKNKDINDKSKNKSSEDIVEGTTDKGSADNEAGDNEATGTTEISEKKPEEASDNAALLMRLDEMIKELPQISDIDNISGAQAEKLLEQLNRISDFIELHELQLSAEQEKLLSSVADSVNSKLVSTLQDVQTLTASTSEEFRNAVDAINGSTGDFIIELENDITISGDIAFKKNTVTINGNGHTISGGNNATIQAGNGAVVNLGQDELTLDGAVSPSTGPLISVSGGATVNLYDGVTIQNSSRYFSAGGVQVDGTDSCVNMFGGKIINCSNISSFGGGVIIDNSGTFNMSDGMIEKCNAATNSSGGGVYLQGNGKFNMSGGEINECSSGFGGGVSVSSGVFTITDGEISECKASYYGGGIYIDDNGTLILNEGAVQKCTAAGYGGGITAYGKLKISGGSIKENKGAYGGGIAALGINGQDKLEIADCTINKNTADNGFGGGIFLRGSTVSGKLAGCSVEENEAKYGGGIMVMSNSAIDISGDNNAICNNKAELTGADIYVNSSGDKIKLFDAASMGKTFGDSGEPIDGWYTDDPHYVPAENAASVYNDEIQNGTEINGECALVASYAIYQKATVSYDLDGGIADTGVSYTSEKVSLKSGSADILMKKAPTKAGYTFAGWSDGTSTYQPGDTISINADITLKAVWIKNSGNSSSAGSSSSGGSSSGRSSDRESKTAGTWQKISDSDKQWKYINPDGSIVKNKWVKIENPYAKSRQRSYSWFHFDNDGIMDTGWYLDNESGDWYMLNNISDGTLGAMKTGWHKDPQDNEWYYLDPDTGKMLLGWQFIDSKWYYFNSASSQKTWDYDGTNWFFNNTEIKPYGAMYSDEFTPDGFYVDKTGKWN